MDTNRTTTMESILRPGVNCFRVATADRARIIVDAEQYFDAFARAAERARRSIVILGWDFDTRTPLSPRRRRASRPTMLGDFLNFLVRRRRSLNIYVLDWDYPMIFGTDREFPPVYGLGWKPRRHVHFRYDNTHPVGGSHHQKIVVIDDSVAFSGGLDLTSRRWDTCEHKAHDPRRSVNGTPYPPFHDVMAMVDGDAARVLGEIARDRWHRATGESIPAFGSENDPWPTDMAVEMRDVQVGVSRTMPPGDEKAGIREIEALYLDMIAAAKRYIYIENQYFTAHRIGDALARHLELSSGPEIIIVLRLLSHGWLEEHTMQALRARLIQRLRAADRCNRLGVYYPHTTGLAEGTCIDVHSKVMIVDDEWLRVGSANICNRSMGMDSECDLTFEARSEPRLTQAVRGVRDRLLSEHLGVPLEEVRLQCERTGSLNATIAALQGRDRTLKRLEEIPQVPEIVLDMASIADPEQPVSLDELVTEFAPAVEDEKTGLPWVGMIWVGLLLGALTAAWHFTPLANVITAERIVDLARDVGESWWAPLLVLAAYTPACIVMFPRPLITLFAVMAFGPWLGFVYALSGILIAAFLTYVAGRLMSRTAVRRLAGSRLNHVTDMLRKRGFIAITALRLVPVAPFAVEGVIAGAVHIGFWAYMLGTAIGLLPGTLATTVFGDQLETALRDPSEINYWLLAGIVAFFILVVLIVRRYVFGGGFLKLETKN